MKELMKDMVIIGASALVLVSLFYVAATNKKTNVLYKITGVIAMSFGVATVIVAVLAL